MAAWRLVQGLAGWFVGVVLVGLAAGQELSTVAYVVDRMGFEGLGSEWHWEEGRDLDPFAEAEEPVEEFTAPVRLEKKPNGSRFFEDGDRMWLLTGTLRQQKILENERSWAVWNEDRNRLVVHGTAREHGFVAILWEDLNHVTLVKTSVELVRVPCRELGGVGWTGSEVRKRGGRVVHAITAIARPGQKAVAAMGVEGGEVRLEVEPNLGADSQRMDARLNYEAAIPHPDGVRMLAVNTGMTVYAGHTIHVEVGGLEASGETFVLGVKVLPVLMDGTPVWPWREFEDETVREMPPGPRRHGEHRVLLESGQVFLRCDVWPTFVEDLTYSPEPDGEETDPFAVDVDLRRSGQGARLDHMKELGVRPVEAVPNIPGYLKTDVLLDVSSVMKEHGLRMSEGTWVYFNMTRRTVLATLTPSDADLFEALMMNCLYCGSFRMIGGTVSLIEWEGELVPGELPAGARRLARVGAMARPGQKVTVRHGWPVDALKQGVEMELEPNIGANDFIIDLRTSVKVAGQRPVEVSTGLTLVAGKPVVVPVGQEGRKRWGLVVECRVIDGTGAGIHE